MALRCRKQKTEINEVKQSNMTTEITRVTQKEAGLWLCVRWGFSALKPIDSTNFNLSTNDYR